MQRNFATSSFKIRTDGSGIGAPAHQMEFYSGHVATRDGYVMVFALKRGFFTDDGGQQWFGSITRFWFIHSGRKFTRTYPRVLTRLGAIRAASRFAHEVVRGRVK